MRLILIKLYYKVVALAAIIIMWVGFVLPYLISAKDDIMVISGFVITVVFAPTVVVFVINIIQNLIKITEEKKQD